MGVIGTLAPFQAEHSCIGGILLPGSKVVIPKSLTNKMLHQGHLGVGKCKRMARTLMFWQGMAAEIVERISKCTTCRRFAYRQSSEPLLKQGHPLLPWARVGVYLLEYTGKTYLAVYDAYSNYPEVEILSHTGSRDVIEKLAMIFGCHGIPLEVCTYEGPQFSSGIFHSFAKKCDFFHVISSPRFPCSSRLAEKGVQVAD